MKTLTYLRSQMELAESRLAVAGTEWQQGFFKGLRDAYKEAIIKLETELKQSPVTPSPRRAGE